MLPTIIVQQADALSGIRHNLIADREFGQGAVTGYQGRAFQVQAVPVGRKRTLQIGNSGTIFGADQPRTGTVRQAMDGGTTPDIIKDQAALRSVDNRRERVTGSAKEQSGQSHVRIANRRS